MVRHSVHWWLLLCGVGVHGARTLARLVPAGAAPQIMSLGRPVGAVPVGAAVPNRVASSGQSLVRPGSRTVWMPPAAAGGEVVGVARGAGHEVHSKSRSRGLGNIWPRASRAQAMCTRHVVSSTPRHERSSLASRRGLWAGAFASVAAAAHALKRLAGHRIGFPVRRSQSPFAEIGFALMLVGTFRELVRSYFPATAAFTLRDDLFQEMAVAQTYQNSVGPWIQTGLVAVVVSVLIIIGVRTFIKSMKEWEMKQERKEMNQMGEDALFLMSTPVDATPLEKKKAKMRRRLTPWPVRFLGSLMDWLWVFRIGACVGYLLPLLNVLDFGEISISLNPYPLGVPASQPIVDFMQHKLHLKILYNAYIRSGYYFLIVWFVFIQLTVRNKAAPFFLRFHSSQAILISMLLGIPQQVFFAVLNPWEAGLVVQKIMYHLMVSIFLFVVALVIYCCCRALMKQTMRLPLVSEAAVMWAGRE